MECQAHGCVFAMRAWRYDATASGLRPAKYVSAVIGSLSTPGRLLDPAAGAGRPQRFEPHRFELAFASFRPKTGRNFLRMIVNLTDRPTD